MSLLLLPTILSAFLLAEERQQVINEAVLKK